MRLDLVDVFGATGNSGNPLAVVHDAGAMDADAMLALTRWIGFSETTFLVPATDPGADYRVRIFYPAGELPFAGHPTLGTCHAWLAAGGRPRDPRRIVQQCGAGLVELSRAGDRLAFRAPPLVRSGALSTAERDEAARRVGVPVEAIADAVHADNGPGWQLLRLHSVEALMAIDPPARAPAGTNIGLIAPCPAGGALAFELRVFFTDDRGRMVEDPVTGSLNAAAAQYLFASGLATGAYRAAQGRATGHDGLIDARIDANGDVWIGGRTATVAAGAHLR
ncbi:PhzF family phenazine biosynthesis protein [Sphingomonas sp.]|uniref:PhzF family phenazine biosynthesis protein n=1 Tax=Sphingomonas sp. TaxID=28214 RepID=UPI001EC3D505|nr:PhzF family phenazine biosynthesis protein [Sphingomonas sp.]MBX3595572.1 PhzF family phenazine biosynthesis protein [Sphingomonas sp.]